VSTSVLLRRTEYGGVRLDGGAEQVELFEDDVRIYRMSRR
jgi:hypothetical protein